MFLDQFSDSAAWERDLILAVRQPLFHHQPDDLAVNHKAGGGAVAFTDTENDHFEVLEPIVLN